MTMFELPWMAEACACGHVERIHDDGKGCKGVRLSMTGEKGKGSKSCRCTEFDHQPFIGD